ncbi:MAG TPA: Rrf2 family transcriptional regulator [Noviherbaspirillum sp.]|uniref:Rrf2 family transcriptional regulator n=1 Tax=Noviherbaspirillum sp. TaxID=1926288 RepID=UPI002D58013F|nr:Rrf2 family transcriptional regulator [Noviherbaspirillum sp.]HYD97481.1 Rrf2 family transcriptional regulator [Noviherbaspirillum sp.]
MVTVEDCILGNGALHDRFFATTEILAKLVSRAPRAVSVEQLEEATGRSSKELSRLCGALVRAGLLRQDPQDADKWTLTCDPSLVTLEDVFRCVLAEQQGRSRTPARAAAPGRAPTDVDLLVMQAMITINQSVFKHLRQFSLDRLKISAAGMFPAVHRPLADPGMDDFDLALASHETGFSPVQIPA